jgi:hypothetical protein
MQPTVVINVVGPARVVGPNTPNLQRSHAAGCGFSARHACRHLLGSGSISGIVGNG